MPKCEHFAFEICHCSSPFTHPLFLLFLLTLPPLVCARISVEADWLHGDTTSTAGSWSVARGDLVRVCVLLTSSGESGEMQQSGGKSHQMEQNLQRLQLL